MSLWKLAVAAVLVAAVAAPAAAQTQSYPVVTIPGSHVRQLHSKATGRDYDLYIMAPAGAKPGAAQKYPVLYLLDGQWDFKLLAAIYGGLLYDKYVPEMVIVGITYSGATANYDSLRAADYTTVATQRLPSSGGAPAFLSFLQKEVVPLVEHDYAGDPTRRMLMGSSFGGLFTLYALFQDPGFFWGYVSSSPAVSYGDNAEFKHEATYAGAHKELPVRLFVCVGEKEGLARPVQQFVDSLKARNYKGLTFESRVIADERHSGQKPEGFNRGLRFLFQ